MFAEGASQTYQGVGEGFLQSAIDSNRLLPLNSLALNLLDYAGVNTQNVFGPSASFNQSVGRYAGELASLAFGGEAAGAERAGLFAEDKLVGGSYNVNPSGSLSNCGNCVVAMDATLAGRPASALPGGLTKTADLEEEFANVFPRTKNAFSPVAGPDEVTQILSRFGNGSRAIVSGKYLDPTLPGHVFNAANEGGVITFFDGQIGESGPQLFAGLRNYKILMTSLGGK